MGLLVQRNLEGLRRGRGKRLKSGIGRKERLERIMKFECNGFDIQRELQYAL
jgi:hypothetical protein